MPDQNNSISTQPAIQTVPYHIHNGLDAPQIPFSSIRDYTVSTDGTMAADSQTIIPTQSAVVTYVASQIAAIGLGIFGDGSDGSFTKSDGSTTTLTRDMYYTNVTLSANSIINANGWRVFINGTYTVSGGGNIQINGGNGGVGSNGANGSSGTGGAGGTAGSGTGAGTLQGSVGGVLGGRGGNGGNTTGAAAIGGTSGLAVTNSISVAQTGNSGDGGHGGAGTAGNGGQPGGLPASNGSWTSATALPRTVNFAFNNFDQGSTFIWHTSGSSGMSGAGGGGGGGGGGSDIGGGGGGGGGSGAPGGILVVFAHTIINSVTGGLQALGGNGGKGGNGGNGAVGNSGGGGGGGGGNGAPGGAIIVVYNTLNQTGSFLVTGGAAGALGTGGTASAGGVNGNNGNAGSAGVTGLIWPIQVS